ncbi:hypothetical protein Ciccas_008916, partial [Cichlidogyrus casuarinus]
RAYILTLIACVYEVVTNVSATPFLDYFLSTNTIPLHWTHLNLSCLNTMVEDANFRRELISLKDVHETFGNLEKAIKHSSLQMENYEPHVQKELIKIYGDLRVPLLDLLCAALQPNLPVAVQEQVIDIALNMMLTESQELHKLAIRVIQKVGSYGQLIDSILNDHIIESWEAKLASTSAAFLQNEKFIEDIRACLDQCRNAFDDSFIGDISYLILLHSELKAREHDRKSSRLLACLNCFANFYEHRHPIERLRIHYLEKVHAIYIGKQMYFEASMTLRRSVTCAEKEIKISEPILQTLYSFLEYTDKSESWQYSLDVLEQMILFFRSSEIYLRELGIIYSITSKFYANIFSHKVVSPLFYRLQFIGRTKPAFLEHRDVIQSVPPNVTAAGHLDIIVCQVKPISSGLYKGSFFCDRAFHNGTVDKNNEAKTICIERTTIKIFPSIPNCEIWNVVLPNNVENIILSPIEVAVDKVDEKNQELKYLVKLHKSDKNEDLRPFTMILNGVLDAAVNGGVKKYLEAFVLDCAPSDNLVDRLIEVLLVQLAILEEGLQVHTERAPKEMQGLNNRFEECLLCMKKDLIEIAEVQNNSLNPVLVEKMLNLKHKAKPESHLEKFETQNETFQIKTAITKLEYLFRRVNAGDSGVKLEEINESDESSQSQVSNDEDSQSLASLESSYCESYSGSV